MYWARDYKVMNILQNTPITLHHVYLSQQVWVRLNNQLEAMKKQQFEFFKVYYSNDASKHYLTSYGIIFYDIFRRQVSSSNT
jgi:hypothetical protein